LTLRHVGVSSPAIRRRWSIYRTRRDRQNRQIRAP
jgi:hypothetical protein